MCCFIPANFLITFRVVLEFAFVVHLLRSNCFQLVCDAVVFLVVVDDVDGNVVVVFVVVSIVVIFYLLYPSMNKVFQRCTRWSTRLQHETTSSRRNSKAETSSKEEQAKA